MTDTATFITRTVLIKNTNNTLYDYFDEFVCLYQFLFRKVYHNYRHNLNGQKESEYRSELMKQFNITNRMAKAIMMDVKTSINSLKALLDVVDSVKYKNLVPNKEYTVDCGVYIRQFDSQTGLYEDIPAVSSDGTYIKGSTTFVADNADGVVDVVLKGGVT